VNKSKRSAFSGLVISLFFVASGSVAALAQKTDTKPINKARMILKDHLAEGAEVSLLLRQGRLLSPDPLRRDLHHPRRNGLPTVFKIQTLVGQILLPLIPVETSHHQMVGTSRQQVVETNHLPTAEIMAELNFPTTVDPLDLQMAATLDMGAVTKSLQAPAN